jgi:hypothetical protein
VKTTLSSVNCDSEFAQLRACFGSASGGSSGNMSEASRSVAASPRSAVPADSQLTKEKEPMPLAHEILDGASGIFVEQGGGGQVDSTTLSAIARSRFVLAVRLRLRIKSSVLRGRRFFRLDAQLRACFRSASGGSSGNMSEASRSVAASPRSAVPADSRVRA